MKITHQESTCFLGRTVALTNGAISFSVTLDVGPRIIDFRKNGGSNVMFEDVDDTVSRDVSDCFSAGDRWHIYGGHRLWLSPEDGFTYYPDNEKVEYGLTENGIILHCQAWKKIDVKPEIEIVFSSPCGLKIVHKMKNLREERELCLWALTVLKSGGTLSVPLSDTDTELLPNRNLVLWPYASLTDPRLTLTDGCISLKSSKEIPKPFKFGIFKEKARAEYRLIENGCETLFVKEWEGAPEGRYPDFHTNLESYCSDRIHEVESLSQIFTVKQGETVSLTEEWFLL